VDWIRMAQDRRDFMNNFLTSLGTVSVSKMTCLHGVGSS
jgi:hypothetical protein